MTLAALPDERAKRDPSGACLAGEHATLDNEEFADSVLGVAAVLAAAGLGAGDVLALALPTRIEFVTCLFAAWRLGAAVLPIDPMLGGPPLGDADPAVIVADDAAARTLRHTGRPMVPLSDLVSPPVPAAGVPLSATPDGLALLLYGGGTYGVMLDHANLSHAADAIAGWYGMDRETACLLVSSGSEVDRIVLSLLAPLWAGGSVLLTSRLAATYLVAGNDGRPVPPIPSLEYVIGAAPMPPELVAEFDGRHGVPVIESFGPAECAGCCAANPPQGPRKPGTAGLPLPGVDIAVVDPRGELLPAGVAGEVIVRGPAVMRGYLGRPAATAETLRGGWLHTGVTGRFDQDGYLVVTRPRPSSASPARRAGPGPAGYAS